MFNKKDLFLLVLALIGITVGYWLMDLESIWIVQAVGFVFCSVSVAYLLHVASGVAEFLWYSFRR